MISVVSKQILKSCGVAAILFGLLTAHASAAVIFYTDSSAFNAASTTNGFSDFEGIVGINANLTLSPHTVDGVVYKDIDFGFGTVCGANACSGSPFPFDSAFIASTFGGAFDIDVSGLAFDVTALGGIFGDIDSGPSSAVISIFGTGNALLDSFAVQVADLGAGLPHTFFGFTTTGGDVITRVLFDMDGSWEAVDDMQFGTAGAAIPLPAAFPLFGTGLGILGFLGWRRRRRAV
jgi:hypothetical protein